MDDAHEPERNRNADATFTRGDGKQLAWQRLRAQPNGRLDLGGVIQGPGNIGYARVSVFSPRGQDARLLIGTGDAIKVWLNGDVVHTSTAPRTAAPDQDEIGIRLKEGWNDVLLKLTAAGTEHTLFLRIAGGEGVRVGRQR
jgi:hypothetical protein